jgi:hypothetical protein
MVLLDQLSSAPPVAAPGFVGLPDERGARRTLRAQIARLERELGALAAEAFPHLPDAMPFAVPLSAGAGGARILDLGELERTRDALAGRLATVRELTAEQARSQARARALVEAMRLEPGSYRFVRVRAVELGERSCGAYHVRPRLGVIGMLMGWWHVKVSSGCPLATGQPRGLRPS